MSDLPRCVKCDDPGWWGWEHDRDSWFRFPDSRWLMLKIHYLHMGRLTHRPWDRPRSNWGLPPSTVNEKCVHHVPLPWSTEIVAVCCGGAWSHVELLGLGVREMAPSY